MQLLHVSSSRTGGMFGANTDRSTLHLGVISPSVLEKTTSRWSSRPSQGRVTNVLNDEVRDRGAMQRTPHEPPEETEGRLRARRRLGRPLKPEPCLQEVFRGARLVLVQLLHVSSSRTGGMFGATMNRSTLRLGVISPSVLEKTTSRWSSRPPQGRVTNVLNDEVRDRGAMQRTPHEPPEETEGRSRARRRLGRPLEPEPCLQEVFRGVRRRPPYARDSTQKHFEMWRAALQSECERCVATVPSARHRKATDQDERLV